MRFDNVLNQAGLQVLPYFKKLPEGFYLSGGTALALQIEHRISIDFDFFSPQSFDTQKLFTMLSFEIFGDLKLTIIQEAENTLDVLTANQVKISFLTYRYPTVYPLIQTPYFKVADQLDIGASKLVAITQRSSQKDYFDIFFILQQFSLEKLFEVAEKKYPTFNPVLYLKALSYFEDCDPTTPQLVSTTVSFDEVKQELTTEAQTLFKKLSST